MHATKRLLLCSIFYLLTFSRSLIAAEAVLTKPLQLTPAELSAGTILLFDGETTFGWETVGAAEWKIADGTITCDGTKPGFLATTTEFANYDLTLEFRSTTQTNSGVFIHSAIPPKDPKSDCYEINIATPAVSPFPTGSLVGRLARTVAYADSTEWQRLQIKHRAGGEVTISAGNLTGELSTLLTYRDPQPLQRGRIALQSNSGPISFRNIKLTPHLTEQLTLDEQLSKWKVFPGKVAEYKVNEQGELHVKNGPGMLEYVDREYGDFVLRWQVKTNAANLNSGVFFRQIKGEFTLGYECQIHNGTKDQDRNQPLDCGSGGFYRRQNARRVLGNDLEWTHMTLVAHGPHMTAWVNGVQVSDWIDSRMPDDNPRKGLRVKPGTFSIQGHDPTTDILFREFQIGEYPAPKQ